MFLLCLLPKSIIEEEEAFVAFVHWLLDVLKSACYGMERSAAILSNVRAT